MTEVMIRTAARARTQYRRVAVQRTYWSFLGQLTLLQLHVLFCAYSYDRALKYAVMVVPYMFQMYLWLVTNRCCVIRTLSYRVSYDTLRTRTGCVLGGITNSSTPRTIAPSVSVSDALQHYSLHSLLSVYSSPSKKGKSKILTCAAVLKISISDHEEPVN